MRKYILLVAVILLSNHPLFSQVPSYVPTNGLVGYWPFSGNANDQSGNNLNGTVTGATLTADRNGVANSAYQFQNNNKILLPNGSNIQGNNSRTISFWLKPITSNI